MEIKLSIGIVTRNRSESLSRTINSLKKQNYIPYEIIISDDSDVEIEKKKNKELALHNGYTYMTGPQKGLYANRNFVARKASGTHFRSMDDDHEFPESHLSDCVAIIISEPETIWTIGEYYPWDKKRVLPSPIPGQLHPRGFSFTPKNLNIYYGISCGASIYPINIIKNGILNLEIYKFGILYLEYGARLFYNGYKIRPVQTTYVIHHYNENERSYTQKETSIKAKVLSMLMLSFKYFPTLKNKTLTIIQLLYEIISLRYGFNLLLSVYDDYKMLNNNK